MFFLIFLYQSAWGAALLTCGLVGSAFAQKIIAANGTGFTTRQLSPVDSRSNGDAQDLLGNDTGLYCRTIQIPRKREIQIFLFLPYSLVA
jgi:hypothetical protein